MKDTPICVFHDNNVCLDNIQHSLISTWNVCKIYYHHNCDNFLGKHREYTLVWSHNHHIPSILCCVGIQTYFHKRNTYTCFCHEDTILWISFSCFSESLLSLLVHVVCFAVNTLQHRISRPFYEHKTCNLHTHTLLEVLHEDRF